MFRWIGRGFGFWVGLMLAKAAAVAAFVVLFALFTLAAC
jgi:hypothetical protein